MNRPDEILIQRVLNGKTTAEEASEVAAWFATAEGREWLSVNMDKDAEELLSGSAAPLENIPSDELLERISRAILRHKRNLWTFRAAAVLLPLVLITALWLNLNNRLGGVLFTAPETEYISAVYGERKEIVFQDGSKVWLNAGTEISYPSRFGLSERRIRMTGEAYFEVASNKKCPFVVELDDASIRVLGTSFGVRAYGHEQNIEVILKEGEVTFEHGDCHHPLEPQQQLTFDKKTGQVHIRRQEHIDAYSSWTNNVITFRDTPFAEVAATLERWYNVKFDVQDDRAYQYTFSIQTDEVPLSSLLNELQMISPLTFKTHGDTVNVTVCQ